MKTSINIPGGRLTFSQGDGIDPYSVLEYRDDGRCIEHIFPEARTKSQILKCMRELASEKDSEARNLEIAR